MATPSMGHAVTIVSKSRDKSRGLQIARFTGGGGAWIGVGAVLILGGNVRRNTIHRLASRYNRGLAPKIIREIGAALRNLNPNDVRELADQPVTAGILAPDDAAYARILSFLIPPETSQAKAQQAYRSVVRVTSDADFGRCQFGLSEPGIAHPSHFHRFDPYEPAAVIPAIVEDHEDRWMPLARRFLPFREPVIRRVIWKISKENAYFTVATALPNVVPSLISLPWAVGEFASDTAVLTMNQVRMAFLIAAASDSQIGYSEQSGQITSIIGAAFGWRAVARELVSKIPAGGGLVSKGLVSFAGTYVVGMGLDHLLRVGRSLTRQEKKHQYALAYERGRAAVGPIVDRLTGRFSPSPESA